jgi:hypothetical protein
MVDKNLSGYNLTGPISPSFGNLLSLTNLWVTFMSNNVLDYYNLNCFFFFLFRSMNSSQIHQNMDDIAILGIYFSI